jgi:hypothetical protein
MLVATAPLFFASTGVEAQTGQITKGLRGVVGDFLRF